jgi:hypothetical protein
MDPIAHTLFGATLAEAGLKKLSRYATPTLLIGANLPDIDGVANLWGSDAALYFRRGWTHGKIGMLVLPLVLAAGINFALQFLAAEGIALLDSLLPFADFIECIEAVHDLFHIRVIS